MNQRERKVKKEQKEIKTLLKLVGLSEVTDTNESNIYTFTELEGQKRTLIQTMILNDYLQIDAKMSTLVTNFFFHHCQNEYKDVQRITTSKEYLVFTETLLNDMPFLRKVAIIKGFIDVPKVTIKDINKLNDLRNAVAHTLMPENLGKKRVMYKGKSIFTVDGAKTLNADVKKIMSFLQKHFVKSFKDNEERAKQG